MSETVCEKNKCVGCMACLSVCHKGAIKIKDTVEAYNAVIDTNKCVHCNRCHNICQNNREVILKKPNSWYQGWANDDSIRIKSSSGGLASAIEIGFINQGGVVCSCAFENGKFGFKIARNIEELKKFAGSKYVKSNPQGIYEQILDEVKKEKCVLFVGLPCQAEAVRHYVGEKYKSKLYTIDLICHGTPSPKLLADYLKEYGYNTDELINISFRRKVSSSLSKNEVFTAYSGTVDYYSLAFLCSIDYTENCYSCKYAGLKRGSDLTLGDSWGSELSKDEQKKGISLVLCQSEKGKNLLDLADIQLFDVNLDKAVSFNHQLREPSKKSKKSEMFLKSYEGNFHQKVFQILRWKCIKQFVKSILLRMKNFNGTSNYKDYHITFIVTVFPKDN